MLMPGTLRAWKQSEDEEDLKAVSEADRCRGATSAAAADDDGPPLLPGVGVCVGVGDGVCRWAACVAVAAEDDDDDDEANVGGWGEAASNDVRGVVAVAAAAATATGASGSAGVRGGASDWLDAADEVDSSDGGRLIGRSLASPSSSSSACIGPGPVSLPLARGGDPCCLRWLRLPPLLLPAGDARPLLPVLSTPAGWPPPLPSSPSSLRSASLALAICCSRAASSRTSSWAGNETRSRCVAAGASGGLACESDGGGGMSGVVLVCLTPSNAALASVGRLEEAVAAGGGDGGRAVEVDDVDDGAVGLNGHACCCCWWCEGSGPAVDRLEADDDELENDDGPALAGCDGRWWAVDAGGGRA